MMRVSSAIFGVLLFSSVPFSQAATETNTSALFSARFTYGDGVYDVSSVKLNWYEAKNLCRSMGKTLISIESAAENSAVLQALAGYTTESFWISGTDMFQKGIFYWDSTGALIEGYTNWGPNQPGTSGECLQAWDGINHQWDYTVCTWEILFICEWHPCA